MPIRTRNLDRDDDVSIKSTTMTVTGSSGGDGTLLGGYTLQRATSAVEVSLFTVSGSTLGDIRVEAETATNTFATVATVTPPAAGSGVTSTSVTPQTVIAGGRIRIVATASSSASTVISVRIGTNRRKAL